MRTVAGTKPETAPTNDGQQLEIAEPAIERLFEGAADPAGPKPSAVPAGPKPSAIPAGTTQEDPDA